MRLSIIIPVLNEREQLPSLLAGLQARLADTEIIIVDGGSTDGTCEWLQQQAGMKIITSERGRGRQQNAGAALATGELLLFLHGDCLPPANPDDLIQQVLANQRNVGGAFLIRFAESQPASLALIAKGINARTILTKTATGDQGIFVRRENFQAVGGFAAWPLFEDVDFVTKLKQQGKFVIVREAITISGRRYIANGPWHTTFLMYALRIGYWLGIHPTRLYQWFADVRPHYQSRL